MTVLKKTKNALEELDSFRKSYSNLPFEAVIKQDILRLGLSFSSAALQNQNFKNKDYFIFTFDHIALKDQPESLRFRMPEEVRLSGGPFGLLPTIVSVRSDPSSPYHIDKNQIGKNYIDKKAVEKNRETSENEETSENMILLRDGEYLGEVEFPPVPSYYRHRTSSGKSPGEIAPVIEWGYLIYLTVFRNCQYFGKEEECAFCDINHNYRQQKNQGRPYTGVKSLEEILEVLSWIDEEDETAQVYTITGGSVTKTLRGKKEEDFYFEYALGIQEKFGNSWLGKIVSQAWEKEELQRFCEAGIKVYHPNYEVWDEKLFERLCPGKAAYIGRETWIKRILDAADVFGPSCVIPNFVAGVELSQPYGFSSITEAVSSTAEGLDFFMSQGVVPRFTTWCPEPFTTLDTLAKQPCPSLEYFLELLSVWKETFERYKLPVPPGYGKPGPGQAVFSVSAFMDVIGYNQKQ